MIVFVVSDTHAPYHDLALCADRIDYVSGLRKLHPEERIELVLAGDILDCTQFSAYAHNAYTSGVFRDVVKQCHHEIVTPLVSTLSPNRLVFLEGNHEDRIYRYISKHAPALQGSVNIDNVFGMDRADVYIPYRWRQHENNSWIPTTPTSYTPEPGTHIIHGNYARKGAGSSVRAEMDFFAGQNVIMGHCHRAASIRKRTCDGEQVGIEAGCSCDFGSVPKATPATDWHRTLGVTLVFDGPTLVGHEVVTP